MPSLDAETNPMYVYYRHSHPRHSKSASVESTSEGEEQDEPKTAGKKLYRRERTRKLRKLNDGGKLEIVQVKTHNSSDSENIVLRPKGLKRSKNEGGGRVRTVDILECEGVRLDP